MFRFGKNNVITSKFGKGNELCALNDTNRNRYRGRTEAHCVTSSLAILLTTCNRMH